MSDAVVLRRYAQSQLAHLDLAKLSDEGVEAYVRDDGVVTMMPYLSNAFGGIKLLVRPDDVERAKKILETNEFESLKNAFDGQVEPQRVCLHCGSIDLLQRRSFWSGILFLLFFFVPLAVPTKGYLCTKCGNTWKEK